MTTTTAPIAETFQSAFMQEREEFLVLRGFILKVLAGCLVVFLPDLTKVRSPLTTKKVPEAHQTPDDSPRAQVSETRLVRAKRDIFNSLYTATCTVSTDMQKRSKLAG